MSAEDTVNDDTQTVTVDSDTENNETSNDGSAQETSDEKIARLEQLNSKLFIRAKEAEGFKLVDGKWVKQPKPQTSQPSQQKESFDLEDVAVLVQQVPLKEDREIVKRYARVEGKTLEDTLNDPVVKGILRERNEMRKTSEVTNTSGSKRIVQKVTDESIVEKARDGKDFDPEALALARINLKKSKKS